ncbi:MAG: 1,4-dihydroxy-6-naphthoate synthase [Prevotellaceae bacterium]|jgi:1,4-dihydroxy-6-naphthoate synthase|nr:1,4-dihydroxy-6-naphthoate synthase [Prevotellaceae bacterium]
MLSLSFSPCPNDTFMFDAMVHQKIDTEGLSFAVRMADIEALNHAAFDEAAAITKLSYHAAALVADKYKILPAGSALGYGNGPLLVSKEAIAPEQLADLPVAIPGKYTTAALLLKIAFPQVNRLEEMIFSDIETAVASGRAAAGTLIHEGRFTYADKGLRLIADLGQCWEQRTAQPVPLGCIAVSRKLDDATQQKIARVVRRSVEFALARPQESATFVAQHAQEMNPRVTAQHIRLYVTDFSVDLGDRGRAAVTQFFAEALKAGAINRLPEEVFV